MNPHEPTLLICAVMYGENAPFAEALKNHLVPAWGSIIAQSAPYDVSQFTDYYAEEMGTNIQKVIVAFEKRPEPDGLLAAKIFARTVEEKFSVRRDGKKRRTLNIDPGFLTPSRLILASTKDNAHRIYLGGGIFGEITLLFKKGGFQPLPWTYPDYASDEVRVFLAAVRKQIAKKV